MPVGVQVIGYVNDNPECVFDGVRVEVAFDFVLQRLGSPRTVLAGVNSGNRGAIVWNVAIVDVHLLAAEICQVTPGNPMLQS